MRRSIKIAILLFAMAGLFAAMETSWSQEVTAGITGTVLDPSGAPINGADVTAKDKDRGTTFTTHSDSSGVFNITRLPVGVYSVTASAQGFDTAVYPPFTLVLNQIANVKFEMKIGQLSQVVEVSGSAPILQTQTTDVSTLIDANTNVSLPLASRNYLQLTLLAPGATNVDPDGMRTPHEMTSSGRPYINGNREQANEYLIDGVLNSEDKNDEVGYTPSVDAIQEFNLITQNASAEFGNYEGGVVSATIKSGTNSFHGDLFEFFRNDALDANLASAGWTRGVDNGVLGFNSQGVQNKPELRYNQFGGTIGGPIIKNKLFFFADYQGQRVVNAGPTGAQVLTQQARNGDFGQLCTSFPGSSFNSSGICTGGAGITLTNPKTSAPIPFNNLANAGLAPSPVATALFGMTKYYPLPQTNTLNGNNYFYNSGNDLNNNQGDLKIDYNATDKDRIFARWSQMDLNQPAFTGCVFCNTGAVEGSDEPVRNVVLDWSHIVTPTLLNEFRFGFNAVHYNQSLTPTSGLGNISQQLGIAGGNFQAPGLLQINIAGSGAGASAGLGLLNLIQIFHSTQGQLEDNVIVTHGRQQIKAGFQFARERQDYIYQGNNGALGSLNINTLTNPVPGGVGLADFYLGNVVGANSFRDTGGVVSSPAKLRGNVYGAYIQDDWRLTNTLTVNLGMRFEDHTPLYEVNNRAVNFGLYTGTIYTANGVDGTAKFGNQALYNNYLGIGDFMPRVGFAWSPAALNGKTVIRGGFGISQFAEGGGSNEELTLNTPFGILQQPAGTTLSQGFGATQPPSCTTINQTCYNGQRIRIFDQNFKPAMNDQWNLTLQHQFSNTLTAQVGYVGQRGSHLLNFEDVAQSVPLNAQGQIAGAGQLIVNRVPGPFLGGGTPGSLYLADNPQFNAPGCGTAGNPACFGREALAGTNMSNADQKYNALQAVLQKRMSDGLQGQIAYTWSKCLSNSPGYFGTGWGSTQATSSGGQPGFENIYNPHLNWGPCYFDQRQILSSYVTYQLPVGHGKQFGHDMNPVLNAVVGNWEIGGIVSLHSGNQLTLNEFGGWGVGGNSSNTNGIGPYTLSELPNCNGPIRLLKQKVNPSGGNSGYIQWFDPSNISIATPNTFGTCSVGNIRGPAYANVDLSLHKDIPFTETTKLEFRFEALNAFNHPVWNFSGGPANGSFDPGSPNFGHITSAQGARELQLAVKFYF